MTEAVSNSDTAQSIASFEHKARRETMDGSTQALLSIIISGTALVISLLSVLRTRKNHLSGILSSQRLVWAENLRIAVSTFITAMYEGENLAPYRARVFLYLSPSNPKHKRLIDAIDQIYRPSNGTVSLEENCNALVGAAQDVLQKNWWAVKSELGLRKLEESRRDAKVEKRMGKQNAL